MLQVLGSPLWRIGDKEFPQEQKRLAMRAMAFLVLEERESNLGRKVEV